MRKSKSSFTSIVGAVALASLVAWPVAAAELTGTFTYKTPAMSKPAGLSLASVSVFSTTGPKKIKAVTRTNVHGDFRFQRIPAGRYIIIVEKGGRRVYQGAVQVEEPVKRFDMQL
jgi:uncharacterized protein (DUF2141 family)